jgi:hypothetical protein
LGSAFSPTVKSNESLDREKLPIKQGRRRSLFLSSFTPEKSIETIDRDKSSKQGRRRSLFWQ